jgi:hypothetical protein
MKDKIYILFLKLKTNLQKEPLIFRFEYLENDKYNIINNKQNFIAFSTYENELPKRINETLENLFNNNKFIYQYYKKQKQINNKNIKTQDNEEYYIDSKNIKINKKETEETEETEETDIFKNKIIKLSNNKLNEKVKKELLKKDYILVKEKYNIKNYNWDKKINNTTLTIKGFENIKDIPDLQLLNIKDKDITKKKNNKLFEAIKSSLIIEKENRPDTLYEYTYDKNVSNDKISVYKNIINKEIYYVVLNNEEQLTKDINSVLKGLYNDYNIINIDYNINYEENKKNIINIDDTKFYINKYIKYIINYNTPYYDIISILLNEINKPNKERDLSIKLPYDNNKLNYDKNYGSKDYGIYLGYDTNTMITIFNKDKINLRKLKKEQDEIESLVGNFKYKYNYFFTDENKKSNSSIKNIEKYELNIDLFLNKIDLSGNEKGNFDCKYHKYELLRIKDEIKKELNIKENIDNLIKNVKDKYNKNKEGGYLEKYNISKIYKMPRQSRKNTRKHASKHSRKHVIKRSRKTQSRKNVTKKHAHKNLKNSNKKMRRTMKRGGGLMDFAKKAQQKATQAVQMAQQQGQKAVQMAQQQAHKAVDIAQKTAIEAKKQGDKAVQMAQQQAQKTAQVAQQAANVAKQQGQQAVKMVQQQGQQAVQAAKQQGQQAVQIAQQQAKKAETMM